MKRLHFFIVIFILLVSLTLFSQTEKSRKEIVKGLFDSVEEWMGTPYVYGGNSKNGIDCSAFVMNVFKKVFNYNLPRTVRDQKNVGTFVKGTLQPGDLVFFKISGTISHIGIYVFDNKFIHAASAGPQVGVIKSSLNEKYYKQRYVYAKRIIELPPFIPLNTEKQDINEGIKDNTELDTKENLENNDSLFTYDIECNLGGVLFRNDIKERKTTFEANKLFFASIKNNDDKFITGSMQILEKDTGKKVHTYTYTVKAEETTFKRIRLDKGDYILEISAPGSTQPLTSIEFSVK